MRSLVVTVRVLRARVRPFPDGAHGDTQERKKRKENRRSARVDGSAQLSFLSLLLLVRMNYTVVSESGQTKVSNWVLYRKRLFITLIFLLFVNAGLLFLTQKFTVHPLQTAVGGDYC